MQIDMSPVWITMYQDSKSGSRTRGEPIRIKVNSFLAQKYQLDGGLVRIYPKGEWYQGDKDYIFVVTDSQGNRFNDPGKFGKSISRLLHGRSNHGARLNDDPYDCTLLNMVPAATKKKRQREGTI